MLPLCVYLELSLPDKSIFADILLFSYLDIDPKANKAAAALKETSLRIRSDTSPEDLFRDFSELHHICIAAFEQIRQSAREATCGLDWDTYLLFNRIANYGADVAGMIQAKLIKFYGPSIETEAEAESEAEEEDRIIAFPPRGR